MIFSQHLSDVGKTEFEAPKNKHITATSGNKRSVAIDFLRYCAVLLVMINHLYFTDVHTTAGKIIAFIQTGGWIGVDLFFVISGYLVGGLVIKEHQQTGSFKISRFLVRRGFKIYPTYFFFIIFQLFLTKSLPGMPQPSVSGLWHEIFFIANYSNNNNPHLWSISVEEHFYLLLSILFFVLMYFRKINLKTFFIIYLALAITGLAFRAFNCYYYPTYNFDRDYAPSHLRFDALFFGVLLAYMANYCPYKLLWIGKPSIKSRFFGLLCILYLSTNFIFEREANRWTGVINLGLNPICLGYILIWFINTKSNALLKIMAPFAYAGQYSYSTYLFHLDFLMLAKFYFTDTPPLMFLCYIAFATIGGIIMSKLVEYPMLHIRDKLFPSQISASIKNT